MASNMTESDTTDPKTRASRSGRFRLPVNTVLAVTAILIWSAAWFVYVR